jgi:hypothetical protein
MARAYIDALEDAYRKRDPWIPGGMAGNIVINFLHPHQGVGESYPDDPNDLRQGLECGGWADMGKRTIGSILECSECWKYESKTLDTPRQYGTLRFDHAWGEIIQVTTNDRIILDPWKTGGWDYHRK